MIASITVFGIYLSLQKRAYRAQKGAHQSAVLVFLGNKSLVHESRRGRAIPLVPCAQTCHNRAN